MVFNYVYFFIRVNDFLKEIEKEKEVIIDWLLIFFIYLGYCFKIY